MTQGIYGGTGNFGTVYGNTTANTADAATSRPPLSVASLNLSPRPGDVTGNLLLAERAITAAKEAHPDLGFVVLPELFTCAYSGLASIHQHAEDAERGPSARFFISLARELGLHVAYGFPEAAPGALAGTAGVYDSANLVGPDGLAMTYRKRHLVRTTREDLIFLPGAETPVVEAGGMGVSLAICWDLGFPEIAREAALAGADLILAPAGWRSPWGLQYALSCAARALDNAVYLASANQLGAYPEALFDAPGHVYAPDGTRLSVESRGGERCVGATDPDAQMLWRGSYGSTLPLLDDVVAAAASDAPVGVRS